jgi:restriction system protein
LRLDLITTPFEPGVLGRAEPEPNQGIMPDAPSGLASHLPGVRKRYEAQVKAATEQFTAALAAWSARERARSERLASAKTKHDADLATANAPVQAHNASVDELRARCENSDAEAVANYFAQVLTASHYPTGFPQEARLAYTPASRQLVVELELPLLAVVPDVKERRYVKAKDEIVGSPLPSTARRALYSSVISQFALRTINELFQADEAATTDTVVLNGHVHATDQRTGQQVHPCLLTVRTTRDQFAGLDLRNVDPGECLKGLSASVSRSPAELAPSDLSSSSTWWTRGSCKNRTSCRRSTPDRTLWSCRPMSSSP